MIYNTIHPKILVSKSNHLKIVVRADEQSNMIRGQFNDWLY